MSFLFFPEDSRTPTSRAKKFKSMQAAEEDLQHRGWTHDPNKPQVWIGPSTGTRIEIHHHSHAQEATS